jgi:hypothetical protein
LIRPETGKGSRVNGRTKTSPGPSHLRRPHVNTRTIAVIALIIAVIVLILLLV